MLGVLLAMPLGIGGFAFTPHYAFLPFLFLQRDLRGGVQHAGPGVGGAPARHAAPPPAAPRHQGRREGARAGGVCVCGAGMGVRLWEWWRGEPGALLPATQSLPLQRRPLPVLRCPAASSPRYRLPQSLPPKNERILRVGMTPLQAQYYQWILKKNFKELNKVRLCGGVLCTRRRGGVVRVEEQDDSGGAGRRSEVVHRRGRQAAASAQLCRYRLCPQGAKSQLSLLNIMVELKKCANHPFLFPTAEVRGRGCARVCVHGGGGGGGGGRVWWVVGASLVCAIGWQRWRGEEQRQLAAPGCLHELTHSTSAADTLAPYRRRSTGSRAAPTPTWPAAW